MTIDRLPFVAFGVFLMSAVPAAACGAHPEGHAALTTAKAAPIVIEQPAAVAPAAMTPAPEVAVVPPKSEKTMGAGAYENCARMKNRQTVYLTN